MKLLDKIKNTFFEEEYVDVEEEKPKAVAKKVEFKEKKKETVKKNEEKKIQIDEIEEENEMEEDTALNYSDNELMKSDNSIPYFDDDDFMDHEVTMEPMEEPKKAYGEDVDKLYSSIEYSDPVSSVPYGSSERSAFKPTPIISPIYGILDKNYKKEEVIDKKKTDSYVARQSVDLDSIRSKAYGKVEEEVSIDEEESVQPNEEPNSSEELFYDMTSDDTKPVVDDVTIADAEEYFQDLGLEYNVDYKDNRYEKATGRRTRSKIEIEEDIQAEEDANLEENLFDIIDSMYDEKDEEGEE